MTSISITPKINRDWLTAKVGNPWLVRRCIGRLERIGYEYRVVVRRVDLDAILKLLADLSPNSPRRRSADSSQYRQSVRLRAAIPLGAALGSILSVPFGITVQNAVQNATIISALCACLVAFIAAFCRVPAPKRRAACGGRRQSGRQQVHQQVSLFVDKPRSDHSSWRSINDFLFERGQRQDEQCQNRTFLRTTAGFGTCGRRSI